MKNYSLKSQMTKICLYALVVACPLHSAQSSNSPAPSFEVTTDVNVLGNYLKLDDSTKQYELVVQWPINSMSQWSSVLSGIRSSPRTKDLYNPVLEKDPSVIIFTQNNPDQISGEDVFISDQGHILQIRRMPRDLYFNGGNGLYNFLVEEIERNKAGYSGTMSKTPVHDEGIVVIYRGNTTLFNPTWKVQNAAVIETYTKYISDIIEYSRRLRAHKYDDPGNNIFDSLDSFMLYSNYPDAPGKLLVVSRNGKVRITNIELNAKSYMDKNHYFEKFKTQAEDAKALLSEKSKQKKTLQDQSKF